MEDVLLSVIVPVYNVEKYLDKCVESVVRQTYSNIEIILVDDGSKDGCPQICDDWVKKDSRIKTIHKDNGGLSDARNAGLSIANGEYVAFVDSDDYIMSDMYEILMKKAIDGNFDIVKSGYIREYGSGQTVPLIDMPAREDIGKEAVNRLIPMHIPRFGMSLSYTCTSCTSVFRRKIVPLFKSERNYVSEDLIFTIEVLSRAERFAYLPVANYYYLCREGSTTRSYNKNTFSLIKNTAAHIQEFLRTLGLDPKLASGYIYYKIHQFAKGVILPSDISYKEKVNIFREFFNDKLYQQYLDSCEKKSLGRGLKGAKNRLGLYFQRNNMSRSYYLFLKLDSIQAKFRQ